MACAALLAVAMLGISCTKSEPPKSRESQLERAYSLIDQNRSDEAIEILKTSLAEAPHSARDAESLRAALASAYVKRAGIEAQSFYSFARMWMESDESDDFSFFSGPNSEKKSDSHDSSGDVSKSALDVFEDQGLSALAFFLKIKSRFDRLPNLDERQDREVAEAVRVLSEIVSPSRGVSLYRGLLKTVRFKRSLQNGSYLRTSCVIKKSEFLEGLDALAFDIESIIVDLGLAFPRQSAAFEEARAGVSKARIEIKSLRDKSTLHLGGKDVDWDWSDVARFVKASFGWDWSCR